MKQRRDHRPVTSTRNHPNAPKRSPSLIDLHRRQIARFLVQGLTQFQMAEKLGITRELVEYDVRWLHRLWRQNADLDIAELKAAELARLTIVEEEAWEAWEKSKKEQEKSRTSTREGDISGRKGRGGTLVAQRQASIERRARDGNADYLSVVLKASEQRAKILGIDKPNADDGGKGMPAWSVESLRERAALADAADMVIEARKRLPSGAAYDYSEAEYIELPDIEALDDDSREQRASR